MDANFGVVVLDKLKDNILLIKEQNKDGWNFVNGIFQLSEDVSKETVLERVRKKTNLEVTPHGVITKQNMGFEPYELVASATALNYEIAPNSSLIEDAQWLDIHEFLHLPQGELLHMDLKKIVEYLLHDSPLNYCF